MMIHLINVFRKHQGRFLTFRAVCNELPLSLHPKEVKYAIKQLLKAKEIERRQMVIEGNAKTMVYGYGIGGIDEVR